MFIKILPPPYLNMMAIFLIIALVVLVLGSYTDFKTREVPDWVNYGLIFTGVGLHLLLSAVFWDYRPILSSGIGLGIGIGVACAMYYLGQWGGGDAKMLMGLGAVIGFDLDKMFLLSFLVNAFLLGAFYGLGYGAYLAVKNRKDFGKTFGALKSKIPLILRRGVIALVFLIAVLLILFLFLANAILVSIAAFLLIFVVFYYLYIFAKSIEKCCMLKSVSPDKLTEGDWIVNDVFLKGKYVCGPKDLGIEKKQIGILKRSRIQKILIKDGIPFVPSFLIAFVFTYFFGNVFFLLVSIL
jgi:Flp pilus assembly protein protease CpaA